MDGAPVGAVSGARQDCMGVVERELTGGTGLIFKGSGFYITDYKDGKKGAGASSGDGVASEATGKAEAKDSKASAVPEAEKANTSAAASTGNPEAPASAKPAASTGGAESPSVPNKA